MKEFKGTKGNWKIIKASIESTDIRIVSNKFEDIAQIELSLNDFTKKENTSNAKLIANAPKMLEELQYLVRVLRGITILPTAQVVADNTEQLLNKILD